VVVSRFKPPRLPEPKDAVGVLPRAKSHCSRLANVAAHPWEINLQTILLRELISTPSRGGAYWLEGRLSRQPIN
jgi:hypothetical protein